MCVHYYSPAWRSSSTQAVCPRFMASDDGRCAFRLQMQKETATDTAPPFFSSFHTSGDDHLPRRARDEPSGKDGKESGGDGFYLCPHR